MKQDRTPQSAAFAQDGQSRPVETAARGLDRALAQQLQGLYRDVMSEPIPADLLSLVKLIDQKVSNGNDA